VYVNCFHNTVKLSVWVIIITIISYLLRFSFMGKRQRERPRRRWKDGIIMDLGEIGWGCRVDSVGSG
jgi:hypothetical protein